MNSSLNKSRLTLREIAVFAVLGAIIWASKYITELLPNIHLVGVFVVAVTAVYRSRALWIVYVFVFLMGLSSGFAIWWIPYLYIWTVLWGMTMLVPKNISVKAAIFVYPIVCGLHGYLYGILYAPSQALLFGLDFDGMISWIIAGLPFDLIHGTSNLISGLLIVPIIKVLKLAER